MVEPTPSGTATLRFWTLFVLRWLSGKNGSVMWTQRRRWDTTHLVTADDIEVAGKLGALLDKKFFAQDLPKLPPDSKTTSGELTEAV
jgi:hypothetical protein